MCLSHMRFRANSILNSPTYRAPPHVPERSAFKTPDIIVTKPNALIECTELLPAYSHINVQQGWHHACGPDSQCSRLYDKLETKMSKYREIATRLRHPYIVAVNNLSCGSGHDGVMEVLFGNCVECLMTAKAHGHERGHMWDTPGLFTQSANVHVSAVLHENESGSILVPNPRADIAVPEKLFPFARLVKPSEPIWHRQAELKAPRLTPEASLHAMAAD